MIIWKRFFAFLFTMKMASGPRYPGSCIIKLDTSYFEISKLELK